MTPLLKFPEKLLSLWHVPRHAHNLHNVHGSLKIEPAFFTEDPSSHKAWLPWTSLTSFWIFVLISGTLESPVCLMLHCVHTHSLLMCSQDNVPWKPSTQPPKWSKPSLSLPLSLVTYLSCVRSDPFSVCASAWVFLFHYVVCSVRTKLCLVPCSIPHASSRPTTLAIRSS